MVNDRKNVTFNTKWSRELSRKRKEVVDVPTLSETNSARTRTTKTTTTMMTMMKAEEEEEVEKEKNNRSNSSNTDQQKHSDDR